MVTIATNPIKHEAEERSLVSKITGIISSIGFISEKDRSYTLSDHISYLLKASENAEPKIKSKIENHLVKLGRKAVPSLVSALFESEGQTRGLVAMALIRIGAPSISCLEQVAQDNPELGWITDYIIREIQGSQVAVGDFTGSKKLEAALVS